MKYLSLACAILIYQSVTAQSSEFNITPPSNEIANYFSFAKPGMNLSKGVLDLSVPLANIDAHGYSLPVTLSYDSRGIQVQDVSSRVGTNWNLFYGGFVARNVIGQPDEKANGYLNHWNQIPSEANDLTTSILNNIANGTWDSQPDEFSFVAGSYSGNFLFEPDANGIKIFQYPKSNIKIEYEIASWAIQKFIITTPDGIKYYFEEPETLSASGQSNFGSDDAPTEQVTTWFISKIILTDESEIDFTYSNLNYQYEMPKSNSILVLQDMTGMQPTSCPMLQDNTAYSAVEVFTKRITKIEYNEQSIEFAYSNDERMDLDGDYMIQKITTSVSNIDKRSCEFVFSNYGGSQRPRLDGIDFKNDADIKVNGYSFNYNTGSVPSATTKGIDLWGYNNGATGNDDLIPEFFNTFMSECIYHHEGNRNPNLTYAKIGALEKIIFPTGGSTGIEYELNTIGKNASGQNVIDTTFEDETAHSGCLGNSNTTTCSHSTSFSLDHAQYVSFSFHYLNTCPIQGDDCGIDLSIDVVKTLNGFSVLNSNDCYVAGVNNDDFILWMLAGDYVIETSLDDAAGLNCSVQCWAHYKTIVEIDNCKNVGGLRIKSLTDNDGINTTDINVRKYFYDVDADATVSSGRWYGGYSSWFPILYSVTNPDGGGLEFCHYKCYTSTNHNQSNINEIDYSEVREVTGSNAELGYTIYNFSLINAPGIQSSFLYPFAPYQIKNWQMGKLISKKIYDVNDNLLHKEINTYTVFDDEDFDRTLWKVIKYYDSFCGTGYDANEYADYEYATNNYLLSQTTSYDYLPAGTMSEVENNYYDNTQYRLLTKKEVIKPDDSKVTSYIQYPVDYVIPSNYTGSNAMVGALTEMINRNMLSAPIEQYQTIATPPYTSSKLLDSKITLSEIFIGLPQVSESYGFKIKGGNFSSFTPSHIASGNFVMDANYEIENKIISYSIDRDPLEIENKTEQRTSLFWGENNDLIAIAVNSVRGSTAYTSFETSDEGNWIYSGTAIAGSAITGKNYYSLSGGSIAYNFNNADDYTLSFWSTDAVNLNLSTGTVTETGSNESIYGFTFHEYKIENATAGSTLTLSGSANIDELRLYSSSGKMVSAYYEPLCGIATYCDANNYLTNAGYDSYQRKQSISDHFGNLLGYFDFHYQTDIANGDLNYSRTEKIVQEGVTVAAVQSGPPGETISQTRYQYIDGLGRDLQDVGYKQSPLKRDVIVPHVYDEFSRELKQYEPFTKAYNNGQYVSNTIYVQQSFYASNANNGIAATSYPFTETKYDNSPLQRKLTDAFEGYNWRLGGNNVHYDYDINTNYDVMKWEYNISDGTLSSSDYSGGNLYKLQTTDEDGHLLTTYKDVDGKVVYELRDDGTGNKLETYYCYDLLNELTCVIPPKANEELQASSILASDAAFVKKWCFLYKYNERGWLIAKAEPGKDWTYFVYDKLNRVAFTQDPNQQTQQKISFVKHDALGREIETGVADLNGETVTSLQTLLLNSVTPVFETRSATSQTYYSNHIAAALTFQYDRINYYDDYDYDNDGTDDVTVPGDAARTKGLVTGTKSFLSGNTSGLAQNFEMTSTHYDYKGEVIRTEITNFEGRTDNTDYTYDFRGDVTDTRRVHEKQDGSSLKIEYNYLFDHAGRPTETSMSVDGQPMQIINRLYYNEIGQLRYKALNGKPLVTGSVHLTYYQQSINYKYNERGWLTAINGTSNINDNSDKFWGEDIGYGICYGTNSPLEGQTTYNGNISWVAWKGKRDGIKRGYGYEYDGFDRLTTAHYKAANQATNLWTDEADRYTVDNMNYDANGNILGMKVQGIITDDPTPTYGTIDNLTYSYNGNVLKAVNDAGTGVWAQSPDFRDNGSTGTSEYNFDDNLNMTHDDNKSLSIDYNSLNLPTKFSKGVSDNLKITYGGGADKLQEVTTEGGVQTGVQQYFGDIIYKYNDQTLQNEPYKILHPEGYWQWNPQGGDLGTGAWEDYYYIKDHLGNVRVVFYGKDFKPSIYALTMEATLSEEGPYPKFDDVSDFRNDEKSYQGESSAKINDAVGPHINIPVNNHDSLEVIVWYNYTLPDSNSAKKLAPHHNNIKLPLNLNVNTLPSPQLQTDGKKIKSKVVPTIGLNLISVFKDIVSKGGHGGQRGPLPDDSIPDGYVKILLLDSAGNVLQLWKIKADKGPGWVRIGDSLGIHLTSDTDKVHTLYVALQNDKNATIWFDTLHIKHLKALLPIVQENHYYPYGNLIADISFDAACNNRELYNTKELHNQLKLNLYNYGARWYDPQVGRWLNEDSHSSSYPNLSGYSSFANNPICILDPDGKDIVYFNTYGDEVYRVLSNVEFKTFIQSSARVQSPAKSLTGWREVPMPNIIQERTQTSENVSSPNYQENDYLIAARTGLFNQTKNNGKLILYTEGGDKIPQDAIKNIPDLDPTMVKAMAIQESHSGVTGVTDLLTSNNPLDFAKYKAVYGLNKSEKLNENRSLYLGIRFLATKGFKGGVTYDKNTGVSTYTFQGWGSATKYYNWPGVKKYEEYIRIMIDNSKKPISTDY